MLWTRLGDTVTDATLPMAFVFLPVLIPVAFTACAAYCLDAYAEMLDTPHFQDLPMEPMASGILLCLPGAAAMTMLIAVPFIAASLFLKWLPQMIVAMCVSLTQVALLWGSLVFLLDPNWRSETAEKFQYDVAVVLAIWLLTYGVVFTIFVGSATTTARSRKRRHCERVSRPDKQLSTAHGSAVSQQ